MGPSDPPRQALPQPYQDMTLLGTLPLWQPGFQQQFCLLGPQELGDLACGRAACWETGPAMEVNSCPQSVVCTGLGGLGSSTGPARKEWSGSGPPSPPEDQREPLAGCPGTLGGPLVPGPHGFLPATEERRSGAYLAARRICRRGSGPCGRPGGRSWPKELRRETVARRASTGSLGARPHSSHLLLLQRKVRTASCRAAPGPAPPRPASVGREMPGGYEGGGQMPAARPRRRYSVKVDLREGRGVPGRVSYLACLFQFLDPYFHPATVPSASTRGHCPLGESAARLCPSPPQPSEGGGPQTGYIGRLGVCSESTIGFLLTLRALSVAPNLQSLTTSERHELLKGWEKHQMGPDAHLCSRGPLLSSGSRWVGARRSHCREERSDSRAKAMDVGVLPCLPSP